MAVLMLATGVPLDALAQEAESSLSVEPEEITAAEITEAETMSEEAEEETKAVWEEELRKRQQEIYEQKIREEYQTEQEKERAEYEEEHHKRHSLTSAQLTAQSTQSFTARTSCPDTSDSHYFSTANPFYPTYAPTPGTLDALGNCTWYAWGRAYEILGSKPQLSTGNAGDWYYYNSSNEIYGYSPNAPKVGAIACWENHVAVVEKVNSDGTIMISESSYKIDGVTEGIRFRTRDNLSGSAPDNYGDRFIGYIYLCDWGTTSGSYKGLNWDVTPQGVLTISGTATEAFDSPFSWDEYIRKQCDIQLKKVVVDISGDDIYSMEKWFCNSNPYIYGWAIEEITFEHIDTGNVTSMAEMFDGCHELKKINGLDKLNTSKVEDMSHMFCGDDFLEGLDFSSFDTGNVRDMSNMFGWTSSLAEPEKRIINVKGLDTKNVTTMHSMFAGYNGRVLDLSSFDTENVVDMSYMFSGCSSLTEIDVTGLNTENVTNMSYMFSECSSLEKIDVAGLNTKNVTDMSWMFSRCSNLEEIGVTGLDTENVTNMSSMFSNCSSLEEIDVTGLNTGNVADMSFMFSGCSSLVEIDVTRFNARNVTNMSCMFSDCNSLEEVDLSGLDTRNVEIMIGMFMGCASLETLDVSNFQLDNAKAVSHMFKDCTRLRILDLSSFDLTSIVKSGVTDEMMCDHMLCSMPELQILKTPKNVPARIRTTSSCVYESGGWKEVPFSMYDSSGEEYTELPQNTSESIILYRDRDAIPDDPGITIEDIAVVQPAEVRIRVINHDKEPLSQATIEYNGLCVLTDENGIAKINNYEKGLPMTIARTGYAPSTIKSFKRNKSGLNTYTLDLRFSEIVFSLNGRDTDILNATKTINLKYKDTRFAIRATCVDPAVATMRLYFGKKNVCGDNKGNFEGLRYMDLKEGDKVIIKAYNLYSHLLFEQEVNLKATRRDSTPGSLSIGDGVKVKIASDVPLVGGMEMEISLEDLPFTYEEKNGKRKVVFGKEFYKMFLKQKEDDDSFFETIKKLDRKSYDQFLECYKEKKPAPKEKDDKNIKWDWDINAYLEGPIDDPNETYSGRVFVEGSVTYSKENQKSVFAVPVVIELSIKGKVNGAYNFEWSVVDGYAGRVCVGGGADVKIYAGVGVANLASAGAYGSAELYLQYQFMPEDQQRILESYLRGKFGLQVKLFGKTVGNVTLLDGTYYFANHDTSHSSIPDALAAIDYDAVYPDALSGGGTGSWYSGGAYLCGNVTESVLQDSACADIDPQIVRTEDGVTLLAYLTNMADRTDGNQSTLVYSIYDTASDSWGTPAAVYDNGTADFNPDFYSDGQDIYAVWQDADSALESELTLNQIADRLGLTVAKYDRETASFKVVGTMKAEGNLLKQQPQIAAKDGKPVVFWHENATDNVLGLSGTNQFYRAELLSDEDGKQTLGEPEKEAESISDNSIEEPVEDEEPVGDETDEEIPEDGEPEEKETDPKTPAESEEDGSTESDIPGEDGAGKEPEQESLAVQALPFDAEIQTVQEPVTVDEPMPEPEDEEGQKEEEEPKPEEDPDDGQAPAEEENENPEEEENSGEQEESKGGEDSQEEQDETAEEKMNQALDETDGKEAQDTDSTADWTITCIGQSGEAVLASDAGSCLGELCFATADGKLDRDYNVESGHVTLWNREGSRILSDGNGTNVRFENLYGSQTLTWFEQGDIWYLGSDGSTQALFGDGRLSGVDYKILADTAGNPTVIYVQSGNDKSELYQISYRQGEGFLPAIPITTQEQYIQNVDGFAYGGGWNLVYNKMSVQELEEQSNILCTGRVAEEICDVALQKISHTDYWNEESGEQRIQAYMTVANEGTEDVGSLTVSLKDAGGTVLATRELEGVFKAGESTVVSEEFPYSILPAKGTYIWELSKAEGESRTDNNAQSMEMGGACLNVTTELSKVGAYDVLQIAVCNSGLEESAGTLKVTDYEKGTEYLVTELEPIGAGESRVFTCDIPANAFARRTALNLRVEVIPTVEQENTDVLTESLTVSAPEFTLTFLSEDADPYYVYGVRYGHTALFPDNPQKEGSYFVGWYTEDEVLFTEETKITEDVTLHAKWQDEKTAVSLEQCSVAPIADQFYTGKALKPAVTVKYGNLTLKSGKDYQISYSGNVNQGTGTVTIKGKGAYDGSINRTFRIYYDIGKASAGKPGSFAYTGKEITPEPVLKYNKQTLRKGTDYTVSYGGNVDAGTACITVTGKGKYRGSKEISFTIKGISLSKMKFEKLDSLTYDGTRRMAVVTILDKSGKALQQGVDYQLIYQNDDKAGTATVTVIGKGNYAGSKKLTYKILPAELSTTKISIPGKQAYTGKAVTVTPEVTFGGTVLQEKQDYTVSYKNNSKAGTATMTLTGKGNFKGKVTKTFEITPCSLTENEAVLIQAEDMAYTGNALKPKVTVTCDGNKLSTKDYTISYQNNKELGTGNITITGKGNYTGTAEGTFRIVAKDRMISRCKVAKIEAQTYSIDPVTPDIVILDGDKTLQKDVDYALSFEKNDRAGTATAVIKGIGEYAGTRKATFKILPKSMTDKDGALIPMITTAPIDPVLYTGYAQKPEVLMTDNGKSLAEGVDYTLKYKNNVKPGTAEVTIAGKGNYKGKTNLQFTIDSWSFDELSASIADQVYNGKAQKPVPEFTLRGENISFKAGTVYTIAFTENKEVGYAQAVIKGKGVYAKAEPITLRFYIECMDLEDAVIGAIPNQTFKGSPVKPIPKVKVGKLSLKYKKDFTVKYFGNGTKGEATMVITGIGNYTGTCEKKFIVQ